MKRLVEFPTDDGGTILVEIDDPTRTAGTLRSANPRDMIEKAQMKYEEALARIRPATESIIHKMRSLPDPPDGVEVEFGIKLSSEMGAILASASAEAHFIMRLTWMRKEEGAGQSAI